MKCALSDYFLGSLACRGLSKIPNHGSMADAPEASQNLRSTHIFSGRWRPHYRPSQGVPSPLVATSFLVRVCF